MSEGERRMEDARQTQTQAPRNRANGSGVGRPAFALASGAGAVYDDPMSKVLGLDAKTSGIAAWFGFTSGSTALLVGFMALATIVTVWREANARAVASVTEEIEVMKDDPPPPPPPAPEQAKAEPTPPPPRALPHEPPPPPPSPAQAAKVLTQEPDPNDPVDLTGNTIIQGNADAYAGGFTASNGTNTRAVRTTPSPTGVVGGTGPATAPVTGRDLSRFASLSGGKEWSCPFPAEADVAQIDEADVMLQVDVRADGTAQAVRVLADPGNGFGREAKRCALATRFTTALDRDGNSIAGTTKPFRVHFSR
jgi:protein TonB